MSGGHGHESHGHEGGGNTGGFLTAFGDACNPASQMTSMFSGLIIGLFGTSGGGGDHHDHH